MTPAEQAGYLRAVEDAAKVADSYRKQAVHGDVTSVNEERWCIALGRQAVLIESDIRALGHTAGRV